MMTNRVSAPQTEAFNQLLDWLNPDREQAGVRYEEIRRRLIKVFAHHGCTEPEDLTDETISRVERNVQEVASGWVNDPILYFYAVARNVRHEYVRRKPSPEPPSLPDSEEAEREDRCLENCLERLFSTDERLLVLQYHEGQGQAKIDRRRDLAQRYGLGRNALRIRIHRLLTRLRPCVRECLADA